MMYEEHAEHARQHEVLRATATGFFVALIAGLLAATIGESNDFKKKLIVGGIICSLSILGAILNAKHYEGYQFHNGILKDFRKSLEGGVTRALTKINPSARALHEERHWFLTKMRLNVLYNCVHAITFLVGAVVVYLALCR